MSVARAAHGVASLGNKIYAVGGYDGSNLLSYRYGLSLAKAYDPDQDTWETSVSMGVARLGLGVCAL